jgi:hypothetical protein
MSPMIEMIGVTRGSTIKGERRHGPISSLERCQGGDEVGHRLASRAFTRRNHGDGKRLTPVNASLGALGFTVSSEGGSHESGGSDDAAGDLRAAGGDGAIRCDDHQ